MQPQWPALKWFNSTTHHSGYCFFENFGTYTYIPFRYRYNNTINLKQYFWFDCIQIKHIKHTSVYKTLIKPSNCLGIRKKKILAGKNNSILYDKKKTAIILCSCKKENIRWICARAKETRRSIHINGFLFEEKPHCRMHYVYIHIPISPQCF